MPVMARRADVTEMRGMRRTTTMARTRIVVLRQRRLQRAETAGAHGNWLKLPGHVFAFWSGCSPFMLAVAAAVMMTDVGDGDPLLASRSLRDGA